MKTKTAPKPRLYMADTYAGWVSCFTDNAQKARNLVGGLHGGVGKVRLATKAEVAAYEGKPYKAHKLLDRYPQGLYCYIIKGQGHIVELRDTMEKSPSTREHRLGYWLNGFPRFPWSLQELIDAGELIPLQGDIRFSGTPAR